MEEKDYASEIFDSLEFDNPDFNITDFKSRIQSDETFLVNLYDTLGGMDETFKERMDGNNDDEKFETFKARILDFNTTPEGKNEVVEADETVTSIDTSIPQTVEQVNAKYDDYLGILLKDPDGLITEENINLDQTIAVDENNQPLKGQDLIDHITKVQADKNSLLDLVSNQQDEITYAQKLKDIQLSTIPKDEEIQAEINKGKQGIDTYWSGEEDYFGGDAVTPLMGGLTKLDTEENKNTYQSLLPTKENLDNKRRDIISEKLNYYLKTGPAAQKGKPMNPKDAMAKARKDADEQIERIKEKSYKEYEQTVVDFKSIYGNKLTSDKTLKDNKDYFYVPSLEEFKENPNVIYDIQVDNKEIEDFNYDKIKGKLIQNNFNSKEVQKEINEVLENFEGEKGVSGWNNVVNAYASLATGFGTGKAILENTIGMTVDELLGMKEGSREAYIENQEQLADAIGLSQKGDDLDIAAAIYNLRQDAKGLLVQEAALKQLKRKIETDPTATQEDVDNFNRIKDEIILSQKQIQANYEYLGDLQFEGNNVQQIIDKTKKSYDELEVLENIFYNSGVRIVTGLGSLANELNTINILEWAGVDLKDDNVKRQYIDYATDILGEQGGAQVAAHIEMNLMADKAADQTLKDLSSFGQGLLDKVKEQQSFDDIDGIESGLLWGTQMLTGQVLNTGMSIVIPGGGGLLISSASEAGNQMYDMKKRMAGEEWSDKEKKYIQDFKSEFGFNPLGDDDTYRVKPEEINALQFYGTAGIYGAAEYVSEKIALGNFKLGAKNLRRAYDLSKTKGLVSSNKIDQRWLNLKETTKDFFKGGIEESFGEGGVTIAQNWAEKYILGNEDISLLDGVTESMVSGFVMNGTMQSPAMAASIYQAFRGPDRNARIAKRGEDIERLSNSIKANELKLAGLKQNSDSYKDLQQAIQLETAQMHELAMEQLADQSKVRNDIMSYTPEDRQALIDIHNKEHRLRRKIDKVNDNKAISKETADASIAAYQQELIYQEAKKKYILGNAEWNADKKRATKFANAYRAKNGTLNKVETVIGDNNAQALENGLAYVDTMDDLTQEEKNQVKEQMKLQFAEADRASIGPKGEKYSINGFAWGDNLTVETTNPDGTKSTRNVDVPMTFSIKSTALSEGGNITVQSHEVGHHTLFKQFMENNPDAIGLVDDLERYVKRNYRKAYDNFLEVKNSYGEYTETGQVKNAAEVAEEKLAALSDFMRQNDLQADRTLHNKLFGRFQKYNDGSGQIRTGKDVFDMITSYNQSFKTGELTGLTKAVAEGTVKFDRKSKRPVNLNKTKPNNTRKSLTKAERDSIEDTLNEIPGPKGADGNYLMNKKDWQADKDRALSKAVTMAMDGTLDGLIVDKMATGDTIHGLSRDEFMRRVYTKLGMHVYNFNPQSSRSLFGWINSYIGNRVGDVANQAKRQKVAPGPTVSTSKKIGDEGGKTVAETIKGDDADTIIAAVDASMNKQDVAIDNLRTRLGIEKGGQLYNDVIAAVEKTFGRTKLKDVSNIKFKQDLKNKFNTELFKTIKNSLGTRAAYKNFIEGDIVFKDKDGDTVKMPRIKMLFDYFAQEVFNKRFEQFKEKLIDPSTGKQARPENNPLFRKRSNITKKELVDYFLGSDVGASTKGTRKDSLASAIAEELAFDATMEVLEDPDIQNKIKEFYELQGIVQAENFLEKVGKIIDRQPGAKFSRTRQNIDTNPNDTSRDVQTKVKDLINEVKTRLGETAPSGRPLLEIWNEINEDLNEKERAVLQTLKKQIEEISTAVSPNTDSLAAYDYAASVRDSVDGPIDFQSFGEREIGKEFIKWVGSQNPPNLNFLKRDFTLGARNKPLTDAQVKELFDGHERLGEFLPDDLKDNSLIKTALAGSSNVRTEAKIKIKAKTGEGSKAISTEEVGNALNINKSNKESGASNVNVKAPKWHNINKQVNNFINDPNFDSTNPKDVLALRDLVLKLYPESQAKEIQEVGLAVLDALNRMVNSNPPFSEAWWRDFNYAQNIIAQQTNSTTGLFRQMANINAVSLLSAQGNTPFQIEHNLMNSKFVYNALAYIFKDAQAKAKGTEFNFNDNIQKLANVFSRNMMLLDKDIQAVADASPKSKEFEQKINVLKEKYPHIDFDKRIEKIKSVMGNTKLQEGFDPNMDTLVNNVLAFGIASEVLHMPSGLTYDQVLLNQMQGKLAYDMIKEISDSFKNSFDNSTKGKDILDNENTESMIIENADARHLFNDMLLSATQLFVDPNAETSIDNESVELDLMVNNKENYNNRNEINSEQLNNSGVTRKMSKTRNTTKQVVDKSSVLDKALDIARDPEAPIKKIRVFDFDDTLARTKSLVFYNRPNDSGKPVPKNKAIFMIGGPGSGKTNIGKGLELGREGWKVVNQDIFIESEKAKAGLPQSEKDYTKEQRSKRAKIGAAGVKAAKAKLDKYAKAGEGMVIDGTGASYNATMKKVKELQDQGYEVFMVHAKTSDKVARERNKARKERSLPDFIVERTQKSVNENVPKYKNDFGNAFIEIDTETLKYGEALPKDFVNEVKSKVYATERGRLTAEEFAEQGEGLVNQGFAMDFSDFNIVREGERGPLFEVAEKIRDARGTEDVFVLTARAPESQQAIHEFLKSEGLNIPIENITGLGNSSPFAKSDWIINKAAEGYNDFYFADDAIQNVQAVKDALSVIDVKSKTQQAKIRFSKTADQVVNDMIEHKFGIKSEAEYSDVKARLVGRKKGRFKLFIPPSAEDFVGLLYSMLGKGEVGNMQMDFFREHLIEPYGRAMENLSRDQNRMINDFKVLKDQLVKQGLIPKNLNKKAFGQFTVQDVARVLAWHKQGLKIPGISKTDLAQILKYAKDNPAIDVFAQSLIDINKGDGYAAPDENWLAGTISTDLLDGLRTGKRSKYLKQWKENVDIIFSQKNLNKMEAAMGSKWREAMENMLSRMESGRNRSTTVGRLENRLLEYINNSVGTVMFFNMRSALLQTISSINFIDFGSNNIFRAAAAFANQKQYWKDFVTLMNSDFLVERRNGLKLNVSESEIADAAATSKNKAKAAIAYILKKGYLPTQFADSFAIASGGATFYRNRIKSLMKNNPDMTLEQAEKQAFLEFREIAEESQQSSRPDRVSQQQASILGRLILAFQNTPMQMDRLGKKSFLDLVNRRKRPGMTQFQSDMSNISRVGYYMGVQSLIFSSLQQALFALAFDDEEPESEKERYYNVANGVINTILNGTGMLGVGISTLLSVARKVYKETKKEGTFPGPAYEDAANEMLNYSPPIDIKLSKLRQAGLTWKYEGYKHDEAKWGIDDPAWKTAAYAISGLTNVPLDRLLYKAENVRSAIQDDWEAWQRVSLVLGWSKYQIQTREQREAERASQKEAKAAFRKRIKEGKSRKYFPQKPLTLKQQIEKDQFDKYKKMNKPRQVEILDSLGLTKKQIRNLKYEKDRINKIIQLMNQ